MAIFVTLSYFILQFFFFAVSSALTYLAMRSWLHYASHVDQRRLWEQSHWVHAARSIAFAFMTMTALIGTVSEYPDGVHGLNLLTFSARIAGYALLLVSTPRRLRHRPLVGLAFILMLLGEAIKILDVSGTLPVAFSSGKAIVVAKLTSTGCMDVGIAFLMLVYTRTVLRVRLTDKFTLAFSIFSLFLLFAVMLSMRAVILATMADMPALGNQMIDSVTQSLDRMLPVIFIGLVVAAAITSFFLARGLIAPVNRMAVALQAIGRGALDYRMHGIRSRDEMQDLAVELNDMARRLQQADALRAEFVSFASHELRNPLTAVKGFIDTLALLDSPAGDGMSQEERTEIYEIVRSECDRLLRMTNELLDNSRVEAGMPVVLNVQQFDVRRRADKVAGVMRQHTTKHTLSVYGPDQPVLIEADPDKLEQILINLLSNAIKYAPNGGAIDLLVEDKGTAVEMSVTDKGVGMTAEQAERVFDKFYRIQDNAGDRSPRVALGTGIGLYLTRALVSAHGGNIRVKSVPDEGSTFTVTLPKKVHADIAPAAKTGLVAAGRR
jgi:signal transduction histidine kinase